jgi:hypothetical protein
MMKYVYPSMAQIVIGSYAYVYIKLNISLNLSLFLVKKCFGHLT